ncbi:Hypothetical protein, putative [Bodo saltans]|uniref:Uncharacterized protein n=1 Tax=Bodo saltans TaxID=75058 RepID=A0A0S4JAI8_BODSA|nr:Hypothetical protein, putative [Bodo saltans]|eukprot:CUG87354.1 Hypothetical protein, putative [Bodo saltans]
MFRSSQFIDSTELQQQSDDAIICNFGPEFFNGARYGSGFGSLMSFLFSWSAFCAIRKARMSLIVNSGTRSGKLPSMSFIPTMKWGFRLQPFFTTGVIACFTTGCAKLVKFYLSSARVNEFLFDDLEFEGLQHWANQSEETSKAFDAFCKDSIASAPTSTMSSAKQIASMDLTDKLIARHSEAKRDLDYGDHILKRRPTFGDGVAVGLFGSIMDCHLPTLPENRYFDWKFGVL